MKLQFTHFIMYTCNRFVLKFKMKLFQVFILFCSMFHLNCVSGEKILVISFFATKSQKLTYMPVLEELGRRGHNVTMLTPIKPFSSTVASNITEILTLDWEIIQEKALKQISPFDQQKTRKNSNPLINSEPFVEICKNSLDLPQVQNTIKDQYDLIFFQPMFNECAWGIIYKLKLPVIIWSPIGVPEFLAEQIGTHFPPSFHPHISTEGYPREMSFAQRFLNFGFNMGFELILRYYNEPKMEQVYWEKMGEDIPRAHEIFREQVAMILSNGHFSLHGPKPYYPDIVDVGGIHSRPAKQLPQDLEQFIQKGKENGFIYFSLGSVLKGSEMPKEKRQMFLNVFSKLKQQVVWKWEAEGMEEELPKNVKLSKWLPQQDILGHEKIKMFITHCGGGSTEEAIYHGCPLVGFPMFGDQFQNAKLARQLGIIVDLDWSTVTEESLMTALQKILHNPKYAQNVKKTSAILRDQPDHPLDRAVFWVEYVMRHKGAKHLRNAGRNLNVFQYHSIDVILCYLGIILFTGYIIYQVLKSLLTKLPCLPFTQNKQVSTKKFKRE